MALPEAGPATRTGAKARLSIDDAIDDDAIDDVVDAVNALVRQWPVSERVAHLDLAHWPANIVTGANMLAARLWRRRDSPAGVVAFGDAGAAYVQRNDPDVAMLLELGAYARPAVG